MMRLIDQTLRHLPQPLRTYVAGIIAVLLFLVVIAAYLAVLAAAGAGMITFTLVTIAICAHTFHATQALGWSTSATWATIIPMGFVLLVTAVEGSRAVVDLFASFFPPTEDEKTNFVG